MCQWTELLKSLWANKCDKLTELPTCNFSKPKVNDSAEFGISAATLTMTGPIIINSTFYLNLNTLKL